MRAFRKSVLAALMILPLVCVIGCGPTASSSEATKALSAADQEALQREASKSLAQPGKGVEIKKADPITK